MRCTRVRHLCRRAAAPTSTRSEQTTPCELSLSAFLLPVTVAWEPGHAAPLVRVSGEPAHGPPAHHRLHARIPGALGHS